MTIYIDARLPADLQQEPATAASADDWTTIQKAGEAFMRRINPVNAVPPLPASKIASGVFDIARVPQLVDSVTEVGPLRSLTTSWQTCIAAPITGVLASDVLLVIAEAELSAERASGVNGYGATMQVLRGGAPLSGEVFCCYASGGGGTITIPVGGIGGGYPTVAKTYSVAPQSAGIGARGTSLVRQVAIADGNYTFSLQCRRVGAATGGSFNGGRVTILRFRR